MAAVFAGLCWRVSLCRWFLRGTLREETFFLWSNFEVILVG